MSSSQRTVLFALAGAALVLLVAIVAVAVHDATGSSKPTQVKILPFTPTATPSPTSTPATATPSPSATPSTPSGVTRRAAVVRQSPDATAAQLATLPQGVTVQISGRTDDNQWLFVTYPLDGSSGSGWIDAGSLQLNGDINAIPIIASTRTATPTPSPSPSPSPSPTPSPSPSPTPTRAPTEPPRTGALPDLAVANITVIGSGASKGTLQVAIANVGAGDLAGQPIEILGYDQTGAQVLNVTTGPLSIPAGKTQPVITGYQVKQRTAITIVLNPNHTVPEADAPPGFADPNNTLTVTVSPP